MFMNTTKTVLEQIQQQKKHLTDLAGCASDPGVMVARGVVDESGADIITGVLAVLLGIPAAEAARNRVWSEASIAKLTDGEDAGGAHRPIGD